ncbi:MAG: thioredoxin family protein [Candidatus Nanopelagicales bacterium]|nr:thioredoxin family protein [Candidatus Nanopelagicales bacterium]MDD2819057.1 thioredoxin family protein [Candidatus Nanopelagicales bacterium]
MLGLILLVAVLALASIFGLWRKKTDGTMKSVAAPVPVADDAPEVGVETASVAEHGGERLSAEALGSSLGTHATLVQFSTAFCQPCRATRRILDEVASMVPGTVHLEIDAEAHLDLVRQLDIRRTPTVLVLNSSGVITKRAVGMPRKADVIAALGDVL